jgi:hypothetical protein
VKSLVLIAALVTATSLLAAAATAGSDKPKGASLVLVLSPSAKASVAEVTHAKQIFERVSTLPSLWLVGIYEQKTSNDGPPFNAAFLQTSTPHGLSPPVLEKKDPCKEHAGTPYQKAKCREAHAKTDAANKQTIDAWNKLNQRKLDEWRAGVNVAIEKARKKHEEAPKGAWDLKGTLSRVGADLAYGPIGPRCAILLGGLVVQAPPRALDLRGLTGVKLLVTGWRGTAAVQVGWTRRMKDAGASIQFLPADVTDIGLVDAVADCIELPR